MGIYTKDAIKEVAPNTTLQKCIDIFKRFEFGKFTYVNEMTEGKYETFGIYTGNFSINPYGLYENFPDVFPYMKGKEHVSWQNSNGKGLSHEQCMASLYVEMIERLSIKLFEQEFKTKGEDVYKPFETNSYFEYLKNNASDLISHFKSKQFGFAFPNVQFNGLKTLDIVNDEQLLLPDFLLFDSMGTNGFTAGNTPEEAITGGIFEIVERYTQTVFCTNEIDSYTVSIQSIIDRYPELENALEKSCEYFDKYDVVDVSITINGVKFYSYFVRTEFEETGHKGFSAGGCHLDQRVAIIRAISEGIQSFEERITDADKTITRQQGWGLSRMFSNYFLDTIYGKIDNLPERPLIEGNKEFVSINEIYELSLKAFKNVYTLDCTNKQFDIPTYIIYIPELFSKSYIWPVLFHVGVKIISEERYPSNLEGLEKLFFETDQFVRQQDETERRELYFYLIRQMQMPDIEIFVKEYYPDFNIDEIKLDKTNYFFDEVDPDSFAFLRHLKNENIDKSLLVDIYSRIGCLSLVKGQFDELDNQELKDRILNKYKKLAQKLANIGLHERAKLVYDQLTLFEDLTELSNEFQQLENQMNISDEKIDQIYSKDLNKIFDIAVGESFEGCELKNIVREEHSQFDIMFDVDGVDFSLSIFTTEPDDYVIETKNEFYIEHLYDLMNRKERKFLKKFVKHISKF